MRKFSKTSILFFNFCFLVFLFSGPIKAQSASSSVENPVIVGSQNQNIEKFKPFLPEKLGEMQCTGVESVYMGVRAFYEGGKSFSKVILRVNAPAKYFINIDEKRTVDLSALMEEIKEEKATKVGKENMVTKNGKTYYFEKVSPKGESTKNIGFSYFGPWTVMVGGAISEGSSKSVAENQQKIITIFEGLDPNKLISLEAMDKTNLKGKIKLNATTESSKINELSNYGSISMPGVKYLKFGNENENEGFLLSNLKVITKPGTYKLVNGLDAKDSSQLIGTGIYADDKEYIDNASGTLIVTEIADNTLTGSLEITASDKNTPEQTLSGNFVIPFSHHKIRK